MVRGFLLTLLIFSFSLCQEYEATVYLKNGTIIRGIIIDEKPNFYIQIRSEGRDLVYQPFEIRKIVRESTRPIELPSINAPIIKEPKNDISKDEYINTPKSNTEPQEAIDETSISIEKEQEYILSMNLKLPFFLSRNIDYTYETIPGFGVELLTPFGFEVMNKKISVLASVNKTFLNNLGKAPEFNPLRLGLGAQTNLSSLNFMYGVGLAFSSGMDYSIYKTMGVSYIASAYPVRTNWININKNRSAFRYSLDMRFVSIDGMPPQESYDWTSWVDLGFSIVYPLDAPTSNKKPRGDRVKSSKKTDISDKINSLGVGMFTSKQMNFFQLTQDYKISDNWAFVFGLGFPIVYGMGISVQSNYNDNGLIAGATWANDFGLSEIISFTVAHQWRIGSSNMFFSLGVARFRSPIIDEFGTRNRWGGGPIISIDIRY